MNLKVDIRSETDADVDAVTEVTVAAFKTLEISSLTEQFIITSLRAARALTISLVAEVDGCVIGHIAFSPVAISNGTRNWYGLGPVSVLPQYQRRGIGKALIQEGLSRLKNMNAQGCCLVGHPDYYKQFGFKSIPELVLEGVPKDFFFALTFVVVAEHEGTILGFVALRDVSHVFHLFVARSHQRTGIARRLWQASKAQATNTAAPKQFTVNSSLLAVPVYRAFGFQPDGEVVSMHGISFLPMRSGAFDHESWPRAADDIRQRASPIGPCGRARTSGPAMAAPVKLDVLGRHMLVERSASGWRTYLLGSDGKRSPVASKRRNLGPIAEMQTPTMRSSTRKTRRDR